MKAAAEEQQRRRALVRLVCVQNEIAHVQARLTEVMYSLAAPVEGVAYNGPSDATINELHQAVQDLNLALSFSPRPFVTRPGEQA